MSLDERKAVHIYRVLRGKGGNRAKTAKVLKVSERRLSKLMAHYYIVSDSRGNKGVYFSYNDYNPYVKG